MKKLFTIILCFGCLGFLEAQNVWKPINTSGPLLGASPDGSLFAHHGYSGLARSQDEGETWQIVAGYESGYFGGYINRSCFAVSHEGRIFVFDDSLNAVVYSDDGGDTWQQTTQLSSCAMYDVAGLCAPSNDIVVVWSTNGEIYWTTDGGATWEASIPEFMTMDNAPAISDLLVNENGDVYIGISTIDMNGGGIFHLLLSDMQDGELVAGQGVNIHDMAFGPDGNVVACGYQVDGSDIGFQHTPGFYLFDGTTLAISDGGIVYTPHFMGNQAVLSYSTDHGEHFTETGEHLPLVDIAPGGEAFFLIKGYDNHLYFDGGGEYWKTVQNADHIRRNFAPLGAEWYFHVWSQGPITEPPFHYLYNVVTSEEEVQGHLCSVIDGLTYVYEENNVVYWYNRTTDAFTVLYDFNAGVGDSWVCDVDEFPCLVTVDSVGSVSWNGHTYRTQYVTGYIDDWSIPVMDGRIIEGVGYEKGLFPEGMVFDGPQYDYMRCYLVDGEMLYHEGDYDCDYIPGTVTDQFFPLGTEWYYEIKHLTGDITYQHLEYTADTAVNSKRVKIITETNTMYDKEQWTEYEYIYEDGNRVYWWNKDLEDFTLLYDFGAEEGDEWEINGGWYTITVHVDGVEETTLQGTTYRVLHVTDSNYQLFTGDIICGIGHQKSFFPLTPMAKDYEVDGLRCYWQDGELVLNMGEEDCDAVYYEIHGLKEGHEMEFMIYPNPTNGLITVETQNNASLQHDYHITNMLGQTVQSGKIVDDYQQIDVHNLTKGIYFITVGERTQKIILL